ncbi:cation:proton antiporter [Schauerella aestuarii]|uniref:cation:proton antiporter n=1 Tax=Schauerella aestuarii TaxID=2511204 RepID=UPI00136A2A1D|nr:cation:proton antiporter [Achromobacter aestuarii]MYZ42225.1 cyclic nucleotide-binding domain-containing protein [Achromobacter aestuarii]
MNVGFIVFGLAGLLTLVCFMPPLAGRLKLPYSVLLAIVGCVLGIIVHVHGWAPPPLAYFLDSLETFEISSETFLTVFLPVLLFETALAMNVRRLMDDIGPILMMAIVAVLVCTVVVGFALQLVSSYSLLVCLLLGAIVATTDPVAVVGIFREVGAPKRLTTLVEGESLFNDAASIALYSVLLAAVGGGEKVSAGNVAGDFIVHFVGGGLAGFIMGRIACYLFSWLRGWPTAEITLTLTLAYLSFYVSEHYLDVSGVVATVIAGLVVGSTGRTRMSPTTFEFLESAWSQFGFWANSLIFLFAAMLIPQLMADATMQDVFLIGVLFVVTLVARAIVVFGLLPLLGMTRFGTKVSNPYKTVMLWGGLRGAVSLALALAVTEQQNVPEDARQFIAVATTGYVLLTLFVNGISLRPLIRTLGLNELSSIERTIRNQALTVTLEDLQGKTDEIAAREHIGAEAQARIHAVFDASLASVHDAQVAHMSEAQRVSVGLAIVAQRETEMFFDILKAQLVDWRTAETLLARAERLEDAIRTGGLEGFEAAIAHDVRYSRGFRLALRVHYMFGFQHWLARELGQRFVNLRTKRSVAQRLCSFTREQIQPLLGEAAAQRIVEIHQRRLDMIENALQALDLQYPAYALWLQESYLGRVARELERMRYRDMLDQFLISGEVYADLMAQLKDRWRHIDTHPPLDIELGNADLIQRVPLFEGLSADSLRAISRLLRPRLALPDQPILSKGAMEMCFVASGAVTVHLPDGTDAELGSGEFFGELALLGKEDLVPIVTSLGYSRLLMLSERDFRALLARDPDLRERIEKVAKQRLRAIEVWRQFSGQQG